MPHYFDPKQRVKGNIRIVPSANYDFIEGVGLKLFSQQLAQRRLVTAVNQAPV